MEGKKQRKGKRWERRHLIRRDRVVRVVLGRLIRRCGFGSLRTVRLHGFASENGLSQNGSGPTQAESGLISADFWANAAAILRLSGPESAQMWPKSTIVWPTSTKHPLPTEFLPPRQRPKVRNRGPKLGCGGLPFGTLSGKRPPRPGCPRGVAQANLCRMPLTGIVCGRPDIRSDGHSLEKCRSRLGVRRYFVRLAPMLAVELISDIPTRAAGSRRSVANQLRGLNRRKNTNVSSNSEP